MRRFLLLISLMEVRRNSIGLLKAPYLMEIKAISLRVVEAAN